LAWREWPLVAFTLLGQLATGIYLFLVLPAVFSGRPFERVAGRNPLLCVLGCVTAILGVAAAASFFHLGRPLGAPNALANLRTSWLSREILFELLFIFFLAVLAFLFWRGRGEGGLAKTAAVLAAGVAVLFLISMARLYMVPGVPAWNRAATPFSFIAATLVLGSLGGLAAGGVVSRAFGFAAAGYFLLSSPWGRVLAIVAAALVAVSVVGHALLTPCHGVLGRRAVPSLKPDLVPPAVFFALRLVLLAGGGVVLLAALRPALKGGPPGEGVAVFVWVAFGLAATSELLARFQFYFYARGGGRR